MSAGASKMQAALAQALEDLHARIAEAVLSVDAEALRWQPAPDMPSIEQLVRDAAAGERRWIAETVARIPLSDLVTQEASLLETSSGHPLFELGSMGQVSQIVLATLPASAWTDEHMMCDGVVTVAGCVLQTLEQLAQTLGRIEMILQLWKARR